MIPSTAAVPPFRIATRGSALALAQARTVKGACESAFPGQPFEIRVIKTTGDRLQTASMRQPDPGLPKGLFTKELEVALAEGQADIAVHSLKDLPTDLPGGLQLGAVLRRADPRDVLIARLEPGAGARFGGLPDLPQGCGVATSSTRRIAQLRQLRPDLRLVEIRGNVPTRLRKLATQPEFSATVLAAAGLARLGIGLDEHGRLEAPNELAPDGWGAPLVAACLPLDVMVPAPGQAAIGIECRVGDTRAVTICSRLDDAGTRACVEAERAFLASFGGGCHSPVAALAEIQGARLTLTAVAFEGERVWRDTLNGPVEEAVEIGRRAGHAAHRAFAGMDR